MPTASKFEPVGLPRHPPRARHAAVHAADPDRLRRRQVLRRPPRRHRSAEVRGQRGDASPSCGSASGRRSTTCSRCRPRRSTAATSARSRCRAAPGRSLMKGEMYLKHFVAAELLLPRHDRVRAAAPQRREPGQERLSRRADHGRLRTRRPPAARRGGDQLRSRRGKCRSSSASRPAARAWSWRQETRLKTSSRKCQSSCSERATAMRERTFERRRRADVAERLVEIEPGCGQRLAARAFAEPPDPGHRAPPGQRRQAFRARRRAVGERPKAGSC